MTMKMLFSRKAILVGGLFVLFLIGTIAQSPTVDADKAQPRAFLKCPTARAATFMYFSDSWTEVPDTNTDYDSLNCGNIKVTLPGGSWLLYGPKTKYVLLELLVVVFFKLRLRNKICVIWSLNFVGSSFTT